MPLSRRLGVIFWFPAIAALILNTDPDLTLPAANSSLDIVPNAPSLLNISQVTTNQPVQNDVSIYCDTGTGQVYGHPKFLSCVNALRYMPQATAPQAFGNRGIEIIGATGLPSRLISRKLLTHHSASSYDCPCVQAQKKRVQSDGMDHHSRRRLHH